jgi:ribosomal protein S18 acetylase RimI-like enzyme
MKPVIVDVNRENVSRYPVACFMNPASEGYRQKVAWLKKRLAEGLKIKLLYFENDRKCHGYIEYLPGECAWRAVESPGYLFIHCLWVYPDKAKNKGYGSLLLEECIRDAEEQGKYGVTAVASDGAFMAKKDIFLKNGFQAVETTGMFTLLVKKLRKGPLPRFQDRDKQLGKYKGLNIVYSNQCPWVARFVAEIDELLQEKGLKVKITELKTARQAQAAPSIYGVFTLLQDGRILADHYISQRRFLNIMDKELK